MTPDKFQQAWQTDSAQPRVTVNTDRLLNEVQRHQQGFRATIFCRDFREVVIAAFLIPIWFYLGIKFLLPWTFFLTVPALIFVAGFVVVDRVLHRRRSIGSTASLLHCAKESLADVEHQIWLLQHVFWWYLLPLSVSMIAFLVHVSWLSAPNGWLFLAFLMPQGFLLFVVFGSIVYVNRRTLTTDLEPRRIELLTVLSSLGDEMFHSAEPTLYKPRPGMAAKNAARGNRVPRGMMIGSQVAVIALAGLLVFVGPLRDTSIRLAESKDNALARNGGAASQALADLIARQRKEKKLVGLAAMVMVDGNIESVAAHGERKLGSGVPIDMGDRWHLGGITKSVTSTMIARLIESGQMQWTDTVEAAFPGSAIHKDWKRVTLKQLLTDTAGAPEQFPRALWTKRIPYGPARTQARRQAALEIIAAKPSYQPGKRQGYSNVGYTIAAAMAEKVTNATWEDLVIREVFEPLGLKNSGFGPPKSPDASLPQPRGHHTSIAGKTSVDDLADNGPIMGPAATIHMSLSDLCTFATEHLRGQRGEGTLLSANTYKLLHTPELNHYACGWIRNEPNAEIPHTVHWHNGSNTYWYAMVAFIPELNKVVAIVSNDGDSKSAESAAWKILTANASESSPKKSLETANQVACNGILVGLPLICPTSTYAIFDQ